MLILRVWAETESDVSLRIRLTSTTDVTAGIQRSMTSSDAREVVAQVETWLEEVQRVGERGDAGG
jgi:hypothetical protein